MADKRSLPQRRTTAKEATKPTAGPLAEVSTTSTPKRPIDAAMHELAAVTIRVNALHETIELHRSALVGALAELRRYDAWKDAEGVEAFTDPVLASLQDVGQRAQELARRLAGVGATLHRVVPCRRATKR